MFCQSEWGCIVFLSKMFVERNGIFFNLTVLPPSFIIQVSINSHGVLVQVSVSVHDCM